MNKQIIGISGKMQHGKTTLARFIQQELDKRGRACTIQGFAGPLKADLNSLGINVSDKSAINRRLMQAYGQAKRAQDPEYWILRWEQAVLRDDKHDVVIVDDVRFQNELEYLNRLGGLVLRVQKVALELVRPEHDDLSETDLDRAAFRYIIAAEAGDLQPLMLAAHSLAETLYPAGKVAM